MKTTAFYLYGLLLLASACTPTQQDTTARIFIENRTEDPLFLQPEDSTGYGKVPEKSFTKEIALDGPRYYYIGNGQSNSASLFITPGSETHIVYENGTIQVDGTNKAENEFIREHRFTCLTADSIVPYSPQWVAYNQAQLKKHHDALESSGLSSQFIATHKVYLDYVLLSQRLNGFEIVKTFGADQGVRIDVDEQHYYDFVDSLLFDDEHILSVPKWFAVVNKALEEMEKKGTIPALNSHYMKTYAQRIANSKVRSHFLSQLLSTTLKKGFYKDFASQLDEVRPLITEQTALEQLPELEEACKQMQETNKSIATGTMLPDTIVNTIDSKAYRFSDFRGKVLVLDFWFTGCVPCKAEMPFFEKLAQELNGNDIQFVSVSLDTGEPLLEAWKGIVRSKSNDGTLLYVNLPNGFKSQYLQLLNIKSVPRIMIVDKEGRIVEPYAKKPSDPKLKEQIRSLLN